MQTCKYCETRAEHKATQPPPPYGNGETVFVCSDHLHQLRQELTSLGLCDPINPSATFEQIWHPPPPQPEIAPISGDEAYAMRQEIVTVRKQLQDQRVLRGELDAAQHTIKDLQAQLTLKDSVLTDLAAERDGLLEELNAKRAPTIPPNA